jgi:peptidoglycan-associated lipoprotein
MIKRLLAGSLAMCFVIVLLASGCATKAPKPDEEVTPPPTAAPAETGQDMKMAGTPTGTTAEPSAVTAVSGFDQKVFFNFDRFDLSPESMETLNELATQLKSSTEIKVKIEGNCDERGTTEYNLALAREGRKRPSTTLCLRGSMQRDCPLSATAKKTGGSRP